MPVMTESATIERADRGVRAGSGLVPAEEAGRRVIAKFFRALGDPTRLVLLEFLLDGERTVSECVERVGLAQSRVSSHLACLAGCGYVTMRRDGRFTRYRVTDPRVAELVTLARSIAADNAAALAACTRIEG
ncbi:MAG: metalloregulator ArsR/SmtB family transcription factor [Acidimicrobiales bacterium]